MFGTNITRTIVRHAHAGTRNAAPKAIYSASPTSYTMSQPPKTYSLENAEEQVRGWGFKKVNTWTDKPNAYYKPHAHDGLTTHLLLKGSIEVRLPEKKGEKRRHGAGERVDIPPNTAHEVWVGSEGATMVIGE